MKMFVGMTEECNPSAFLLSIFALKVIREPVQYTACSVLQQHMLLSTHYQKKLNRSAKCFLHKLSLSIKLSEHATEIFLNN